MRKTRHNSIQVFALIIAAFMALAFSAIASAHDVRGAELGSTQVKQNNVFLQPCNLDYKTFESHIDLTDYSFWIPNAPANIVVTFGYGPLAGHKIGVEVSNPSVDTAFIGPLSADFSLLELKLDCFRKQDSQFHREFGNIRVYPVSYLIKLGYVKLWPYGKCCG